jgi:polyhydroxyalkanoate synthesis regulator phasin
MMGTADLTTNRIYRLEEKIDRLEREIKDLKSKLERLLGERR